jgi:hypothetical protein
MTSLVQVGVYPLQCRDMDCAGPLKGEARSEQKSASAGQARRMSSSLKRNEENDMSMGEQVTDVLLTFSMFSCI